MDSPPDKGTNTGKNADGNGTPAFQTDRPLGRPDRVRKMKRTYGMYG